MGTISRTCKFLTLAILLLPVTAGAFCFEDAGLTYGVSPLLLRGIARVESGENPAATNRNRNGSVDLGLMQINSSWLKPLGATAKDLIDRPCYNVMVGAWILSDCLKRYGNSWEAIGCYNAKGHDHRVTYSWKIYRELQHVSKSALRPAKGDPAVAASGPPRPPLGALRQGEARQDRSADRTEKEKVVPAVSSINVSVTDKD